MDRTLEMPEQALKAIWDKIFNILPGGETTLTSGNAVDDDITFIRGSRHPEASGGVSKEAIEQQAEINRQKQEKPTFKHVTAKKPNRKELQESIRINDSDIHKNEQLQKKVFQQLSSHYNTQKFVCNTKHSLYNSGACKSVKSGIVDTRKQIQDIDVENQALRSNNKALKRLLQVSGSF